MADKTVKKEEVTVETTEKPQAKATNKVEMKKGKPKNSSLYTINELVDAEKELDASKVVIRIALQKAKKDLFSIEEAKEIVTKFKEREVK